MSRETMAATQGHRGTSRKFGRVTVGRLYDERVDERVDIMMPFTLVTMPHHARQSKPTTTRIAVSMPLLRSSAAGLPFLTKGLTMVKIRATIMRAHTIVTMVAKVVIKLARGSRFDPPLAYPEPRLLP